MIIKDAGENNTIEFGENLHGEINITGSSNTVLLKGSIHNSKIRVNVFGNNNTVEIGLLYKTLNPILVVGSHVHANRCHVLIDNGFSCEPNCEFLISNTNGRLSVGRDCMFSRDIVLRTGESPHLLFDNETEEYLDVSDGVSIGNHVWVGERSYITKRAGISDGSIVAACAVVTKKFLATNVAIGGNPARIIRENIRWERNYGMLDRSSLAWKNWQNTQ